MNAVELYELYHSNMTSDEVTQICQAILNAPGNQAWAISEGKSDGWWDDNVAEPCQAILEAPGDQAWAISVAKMCGWWKDPIKQK